MQKAIPMTMIVMMTISNTISNMKIKEELLESDRETELFAGFAVGKLIVSTGVVVGVPKK